jgi:hypothetical protein
VPPVRVPFVGSLPGSFAVVPPVPVPRVEVPPAGVLLVVVPLVVVLLVVVPPAGVLLVVVPPAGVLLVVVPGVEVPPAGVLVVVLLVVVPPAPVPRVEVPPAGVLLLVVVPLGAVPAAGELLAGAVFFGVARRALLLAAGPASPPVSTSTSPSEAEEPAGSLLPEPPVSLRTPVTICSYFSRPARLPST